MKNTILPEVKAKVNNVEHTMQPIWDMDTREIVGYVTKAASQDFKDRLTDNKLPNAGTKPAISLHLAGDIFSFLERMPESLRSIFHADCHSLTIAREAKALQDRIWAAYGNQKPGDCKTCNGTGATMKPLNIKCADCNGTGAVPAMAEENQDNGYVPCPTCNVSNPPRANKRQIEAARKLYCSGDSESSREINIDEGALLSIADTGVWLQGWLWLSDETCPECHGSNGTGGANDCKRCDGTGYIRPEVEEEPKA